MYCRYSHRGVNVITCSNSQRKILQIAQIRHFEPQRQQNKAIEVDFVCQFVLSLHVDISRINDRFLR